MALGLGRISGAQLLSCFRGPTWQGRGPPKWELSALENVCYLFAARIRRIACVPEPHWLGPRKTDIFEGFVRSASYFGKRLSVVVNQWGWGAINRDGF